MHERVANALFDMYDVMEYAVIRQNERGGHDQGARSQVTGGTHLNLLASTIREDLIDVGYSPNDVVTKKSQSRLPGWFRAHKEWDLLAFDGDDLLAAVELKSQNSSFANNQNNRIEEAIGNAIDTDFATRNGLLRYRAVPPVIGYALVLRDCSDSHRLAKEKRTAYPILEEFQGTTYLDSWLIACRRMLAERIYQAIWVVWVNPDEGLAEEPDPDLSYERFIETLAAQLRINRA